MFRSTFCRLSWAVILLSTTYGGVASAQLWRHFVPTGDERPVPNGDYSLAQENGPWLIVAASFSGDGAEKQAGDLARELRERFRLQTYLHEMSFKLGGEARGGVWMRTARQ